MAATMEKTPTKAELDKMQAEIGTLSIVEQHALLMEAKAKREREALEAENAKHGADRVMVYSIFDGYHLGCKAMKKKRTGALNSNGTPEMIPDENAPHRHHQFRSHRCWIRRDDLARMRKQDGYGREFVEALPANDGDNNAKNLDAMLKTFEGEAFLGQIKNNDVRQMIRPPLEGLTIRLELEGLRKGTVKAPPIKD